VNIAPLLSLYITGGDDNQDLPPEWSASLARFDINPNGLIDSVVNNSILYPMLTNPLTPSDLFSGKIGLISDPEFPGGWDGVPGEPPTTGWWPEAIQRTSRPPLAYPADPYPMPVLAFFVPIKRPRSGDARTIDLARMSFAITAPARPEIWLTADGHCGYAFGEDAQHVNCVTVDCPTPCIGSPMAMDFGRKAVLCRCPGC
jgi:hypothetical protein